jgi:hypothetical protein
VLARFLTACWLALSLGCGKQPAQTSSPSAPGQEASSAAAANEAQIAAALNKLTQAVRKYSVEQQRVPKSLDDVVAGGYLDRIPPAPSGKRFAIDKNLQVYLANQ